MSTHNAPSRNESRELAKEGLGLMVTRRQMLAGAALGLAALALPTPLLDLVPGAKPREAEAWIGMANWLEDGRAYIIAAEANQNYLLVPKAESTSDYNDIRTEHRNTCGTRMFWYAENTGYHYPGSSETTHQYWLRNWITGKYLDRYANGYYNGCRVGVSGMNKSVDYQKWWCDHNNNDAISIITVGGHTGNGWPTDEMAVDTTGTLGKNCHIWHQDFMDGWMGSSNVNQRFFFYHADYYFDVNPDENKYGVSYSKGARVKSFALKATVGSKQTYSKTGLEDYNRRDLYGAVYKLTNVTYRTGYRFKNCKLSKGTLQASATNGTSFTVKHSVWEDISLSINTEPIPFNLDVTFDGDKYGKTYTLGAHVKSFSMKVTLDGTVTYNKTKLEDYNRQDGFNCIYEITNVVYRDEYVYAGCTLSAGKMISKTDDGTSFKFQHTAAKNITFDIQTKDAIIYPKGPTKSVKITS